MSAHLSYFEAVIVGAFQGVTELFPVSSLGHAVLVPALIGGQWARDLSVSAPDSPYLAFIVGLHVATAIPPNPDPQRAAGLAAGRGHHPGGSGGPGFRTAVPHHARQARPGG